MIITRPFYALKESNSYVPVYISTLAPDILHIYIFPFYDGFQSGQSYYYLATSVQSTQKNVFFKGIFILFFQWTEVNFSLIIQNIILFPYSDPFFYLYLVCYFPKSMISLLLTLSKLINLQLKIK